MKKPTIIFYLHGFNARFDTSAQKVVTFQNILPVVGFTVNYFNEDEVQKLDRAIINVLKSNHIVFVGSSLGGYMARYFANKFKQPCVLLNPSLDPTITLMEAIGTIQIDDISKKTQLVTADKINTLKNYAVPDNTNFPTLLLLAQDDETLDYRIALNRLQSNVTAIIKEAGGHRLTNIEQYMDDVQEFINNL